MDVYGVRGKCVVDSEDREWKLCSAVNIYNGCLIEVVDAKLAGLIWYLFENVFVYVSERAHDNFSLCPDKILYVVRSTVPPLVCEGGDTNTQGRCGNY